MNSTEELRNLMKIKIDIIRSEEDIAYLLEKSREILNRRSGGNGNHQNRSQTHESIAKPSTPSKEPKF